MITPFLFIDSTHKRGRGVFTTKKLGKGKIIEVSPVIVLTQKERKIIENTKLFDYIFEWGNNKKMACVALGYVSLYNHEYSSNCEYEMDFETRLMTIRTVRTIQKGEELTINYNASPNDKTEVWFDTH